MPVVRPTIEYVVVESAIDRTGAVIRTREFSACRDRTEAEAQIELHRRQPASDDCYLVYSIDTRIEAEES